MAEPLAWDSLRGNKPRGSTGGRPWFGMCNDMQLALAICGAICTGRFLPWVGVPGSRANVEGASRFSPGADVGGISLVEHAAVVSPVSVQMWGGVNPVLSANTACVSRILCRCVRRLGRAESRRRRGRDDLDQPPCRCVCQMRARVRPALVPKRAGAGPAGPEAKCRGVGRVPAQIWLGASPVPVQIWESGEGDTSGKGPGCSTRASMHLASITGAPCCDQHHAARRSVPVQMWAGWAKPCGRCRRGAPSPGAE